MSKLQEFKKLQEAVSTFANTHKDEIFADALAGAFAVESGIKAILINGYTPGFNDGDPCTHTQYSVIEADELKDHVSGSEEMIAFLLGFESEAAMYSELNEKDLDTEEALEGLDLGDFPYEVTREVNSHLDGVEDVLHEVMGTDWQILAVRMADGSIKTMTNEYYDCGY